MGIEGLRCESCGGRLIHHFDKIWICEHCQLFNIVTNGSDAAETVESKASPSVQAHILQLSIGERAIALPLSETLKMTFHYHRRATKADRFPAYSRYSTDLTETDVIEDLPPFEYKVVSFIVQPMGITAILSKKDEQTRRVSIPTKTKVTINGIDFELLDAVILSEDR